METTQLGSFLHHKTKGRVKMKKIGLILVVFGFLISGASAGQSSEVGDSAPDFNLVSASGDELRLSDYKGKKNVILIFYADNT
jgi:cytochrome oxidase Cu insertion factor (SCO1/SenC/PrrC family)